jgi:hypothetical protein
MIVCWLNRPRGWLTRMTLCGARFCIGSTLGLGFFSPHQVGGGSHFWRGLHKVNKLFKWRVVHKVGKGDQTRF